MRNLTEANRRFLDAGGFRVPPSDTKSAAAGGTFRPTVSSGAVVVPVPAYGGTVGHAVKCVAGTWSALTDADAGAFLVGVIISVDAETDDAVVQIAGTRDASGTAGTVYYAPASAGAPTSTRPIPAEPPTVSPWERWVEIQVAAGKRMVVQAPAFRLLKVDDCEASPVTHYVPETTV
jgi:hypothetical protein